MKRTTEYTSDNSPNKKYILDTRFSHNIDTEDKAYLLGWAASDDSIIRKCTVNISVKESDKYVLYNLGSLLNKEMVKDISKHFDINIGKKSTTLNFDLSLYPKNIQIAFVQAYFEGNGTVSTPSYSTRYPTCSIFSNSLKMLESIQSVFKGNISKCTEIVNGVDSFNLYWSGNNCLDFLGTIYQIQNLN